MKKLLAIIGIMAFLSACNNSPATEEINDPAEEQKSSGEIQTEILEEQGESIEDLTDSVVIGAEKTYLWEEESTGIQWMSYYAMIQNDSDTTIDVRDAQITFYDANDEVVGVSNQGISVYPYVLAPGEYAGVYVYDPPNGINVDEEIHGELAVNPFETEQVVHRLDTDGINNRSDSTGLKVTGEITNNNDSSAQELSVIVAIYDENDDFLGLVSTGSDSPLQPGSSTGFEAFSPPFPDDELSNVDSFEVDAFWIE